MLSAVPNPRPSASVRASAAVAYCSRLKVGRGCDLLEEPKPHPLVLAAGEAGNGGTGGFHRHPEMTLSTLMRLTLVSKRPAPLLPLDAGG